MAIVTVNNEKGFTAKVNFNIYDNKNEIKESGNSYSVENGLINQSIEYNLFNGIHKITFPISFNKKCNGVFLNTDTPNNIKEKVRIVSFDLNGFTFEILPHEFDFETKIKFIATGI